MTKIEDFTQRVGAYRKACLATNHSPDVTILERLVADVFTIEEQRALGSSARIVTDALNQTRGSS
jgi:hypothetical protein